MFIEAKDDGGGGDNWTTGAISREKLQSNHHHQQTNTQFFTGRMPFSSPNQQCQSTEGTHVTKYNLSSELLQTEHCQKPLLPTMPPTSKIADRSAATVGLK